MVGLDMSFIFRTTAALPSRDGIVMSFDLFQVSGGQRTILCFPLDGKTEKLKSCLSGETKVIKKKKCPKAPSPKKKKRKSSSQQSPPRSKLERSALSSTDSSSCPLPVVSRHNFSGNLNKSRFYM